MMKILITGAGSVMGQSIFKALGVHDFSDPPQIHFANSDPLGAGRFFTAPRTSVVATPIFPLAADPLYLDHLSAYVDEHRIDVVFAGTQHELGKISIYRDLTLKAATIPSKIAQICMDKVRTSQVLGAEGIRVPETLSLRDYLSSDAIRGPVVVKPNFSSASRKIFRSSEKSEIQQLVDEGLIDVNTFLVQEMLIGDEYTCGCYVDRYDASAHLIVMRRTLTADGATGYGEIVQDIRINNYVASVAAALVRNGLDFGHINVQLIMTATGPVLFEINGRLSSTEAAKAHFGFNSCAAFVANIVEKQAFTGWRVAKAGRFLRYYEEVYFD